MKRLALKERTSLAAAIAAGATFLVYLPSLWNRFVDWDDTLYVLDNMRIRSLNSEFLRWAFTNFDASNWHPLTWISHALDHAVWGGNAAGHHATNMVIHVLNTALVTLLVSMLMRSFERSRDTEAALPLRERTILVTAGLTGLLFGLHPLHVESVAWVAERKDLLCGLFFLLSLVAYTNYASGKPAQPGSFRPLSLNRQFTAALALFALALMSKPMAVSLPVVLLILDWHPFNRIVSRRSLWACSLEKLPFIALSAGVAVLAVMAQKRSLVSIESATMPERLLVAVKAVMAYLGKMLVPVNLIPYYQYPDARDITLLSFTYALPLLLFIGITAFAVMTGARHRTLPALWACYLVTLLPVLGIVQVGAQSMADRYTYLPAIAPFFGFALAAGILSDKLPAGRRYAALAFGTVGLLFLSAATVHQIGIWKDSFTLWDYSLQKDPGIYSAYNNRGFAHARRGRLDDAIADFSSALSIRPDYADAHNNLGNAYAAEGRLDEAIQEFSSAIRIEPEHAEAYNNIGNAFADQGRLPDARAAYEAAIGLYPGFAVAHNNLGLVYFELGLMEDAVGQFRIAVGLDPYYAKARYHLGRAYVRQGRIQDALDQYASSLEINPALADARSALEALQSGQAASPDGK